MQLQQLQIVVFIALSLVATGHSFRFNSLNQIRAELTELWNTFMNTEKDAKILEELQKVNEKMSDARSMSASGGCSSTLKVSASTGNHYHAGISPSYHHLITLTLENGNQIQKNILGPIYNDNMYTFEINLDQCLKQSDIEKVDLEAGGNDGWYINSITTYIKVGTDPYSVLTSDPVINRWLDGDESYPYDAKKFTLSMGGLDCLTTLKISARTGNANGAGFTIYTTHHITLTLENGKQLTGNIPGPANHNENYIIEISFSKLNPEGGCVKQSDIQMVDLVAGGNDGWNIKSITTFVKPGTGIYDVLTIDPSFDKWLDGNQAELYLYDATQIPLTLSMSSQDSPVDTPYCGYGIPVCECRKTAKTCIFNLEVDEIRTFTSYQKSPEAGMFVRGAEGVVYSLHDDGQKRPLVEHEDRACGNTFTPENCTEPHFVDGKSYRLAIAVNGQIPGPTIIVHEQQTIVMHVHNNLTVEGISVHWHGMHQIGTPFMDGVGQVTQCHIGPSSTFTYAYLAQPSGTFWYHSHSGLQRTDGLFGTMIIKENSARLRRIKHELGLGEFEDLPGKHSLTLLDWMHESALDTLSQLNAGVDFYLDLNGNPPTDNSTGYQFTRSYEGIVIGPVPYFSGLINGKGRHNDVPYAKTRLSVFTVEQNKKYRFRLIGAQGLYAYKFSIDGHKLTVVNTDGYWLEPVEEVDFIILHTGERYDFILEANAISDKYWMRAETLEVDTSSGPPFNSLGHVAEGILQYKCEGCITPIISSTQYESIKNNSPPINCTQDNKCKAVNCPFENFHESYHINCTNVDKLRLLEETPLSEMPGAYPSNDDSLKFINFNFEGDSDTSSVNGRNFILPPAPPQTQNAEFQAQAVQCNLTEHCNPSTIDCLCTQVIDIPHNKTVQFVLSSHGRVYAVHPIHLHGHTFHVVRIGYPEYDESDGTVIDRGANSDIECLDNCTDESTGCSTVACTVQRWNNGTSPPLSIDNKTIRKDTIMVPAGGYVVINIISNNPGYWFMHCHIEEHQIEGMALIINEAFEQQCCLPPPPKSINKCGNVDLSLEDYKAYGLNSPNLWQITPEPFNCSDYINDCSST